jgi:hypothetical protein
VIVSWLTALSQIKDTAVGHEFRQDEWPSIAASPDGSLWVAWLSYVGERDDLAICHYKGGQWGNLRWVPNTSSDNWMPVAGVDELNRLWVVWPQHLDGNCDIYARRYDPAKREWSKRERLSSDPGPDSNIRLASDGSGNLAVVGQGFRGKNSNIFCNVMKGEKWVPKSA